MQRGRSGGGGREGLPNPKKCNEEWLGEGGGGGLFVQYKSDLTLVRMDGRTIYLQK